MLRRRDAPPVDDSGGAGGRTPGTVANASEPVFRSAAFASFLEAVGSRGAPELLDLGPVIGANIAFLGERVGCKIHIEDLGQDIDQRVREEISDGLPELLETRFVLPADSLDGVLCWDLFDRLDAPAASVLARQLTRMLRPGGVLLAFFGVGTRCDNTTHRKFVIEDTGRLRLRARAAAAGSRYRALENREAIALLEPLAVAASVLLRCQLREMLFRKPPSRPS